MGDTSEPFWFKQERKRIFQNFIDQESKHKTLEDDAKDASNFLVQLSRLSQNITKANPNSGGIDAATSLKLRNFKTKNPRDAVMQIILNFRTKIKVALIPSHVIAGRQIDRVCVFQ